MDPGSLPDHPATPTTGARVACHGPYEHQPHETFIAPARRTAMLTQALHGVALGTWDLRILQWLAHWCDTPTFLAILGMLQRARIAAQAAPQREAADLRRQLDQATSR
jgi:hypothetical protein